MKLVIDILFSSIVVESDLHGEIVSIPLLVIIATGFVASCYIARFLA